MTTNTISSSNHAITASGNPIKENETPDLLEQKINQIRDKSLVAPQTLSYEVPPTLKISEQQLLSMRKGNFFRRISEQEWREILSKITSLNRPIAPAELQALQLGKWGKPIFADPHWIYLALQAYLEGTIDLETISKLCLYASCQDSDGQTSLSRAANPTQKAEESPSLPNKQKTLQTFQLISSKGEVDEDALRQLETATYLYQRSDFMRRLFHNLRQVSPEKTQFFTIELELDPGLQAITEEIGWNLFVISKNISKDPSTPSYVGLAIMPPEMAYAIHHARFRENAIRPIPSLGFSPKEILSNPTSRIVTIPAPFVKLPEMIHEMRTHPLAIYHHDIGYHHAIESANMHRPVWIAFAQFVKEVAQKRKDEKLQRMVPTLLDRDLTNYIQERRHYYAENFWLSLAYSINQLRNEHHIPSEKLPFFQRLFLFLFAEFYRTHRNWLNEKYSINIETLQKTLANAQHPFRLQEDRDFLIKTYVFLEKFLRQP